MPRTHSPVDQYLADQATLDGSPTTARQVERWRNRGLLPPNVRAYPGRGSIAKPAPGAVELVKALARHARPGRRPNDLALLAFGDGHAVPEQTVRRAFASAAGTGLAVEHDLPADSTPDDVADAAVSAGIRGTLLPDRVRRIDNALTRLGVDWAPPAVAKYDTGPARERATAKDWTYQTVLALRTGGSEVTVDMMGAMARSMMPAGAAAPFAASMEDRWPDNDAEAELLLNDAGGLAFMPTGDVRELFDHMANSLPMSDLHAGWMAATRLRRWAVDLCDAVEREIAADALGSATGEWVLGVMIGVSRMLLATGLRDAEAGETTLAFTAMLLILMRTHFARLGDLMPDGQFEYLAMPGVLAACLSEFFGAVAGGRTSTA
jgi:hypothetical protein